MDLRSVGLDNAEIPMVPCISLSSGLTELRKGEPTLGTRDCWSPGSQVWYTYWNLCADPRCFGISESAHGTYAQGSHKVPMT